MAFGDPFIGCAQMEFVLNVMVKEGGGTVKTVAVAELVQLFSAPITVYVVNVAGLLIILNPVTADEPAEELQVYEDAEPEAVKFVLFPVQTVADGGLIKTDGSGNTVTVKFLVALLQPRSEPKTEYTVETKGETFTLGPE
jgi:hypothetical protein